MLPPAGHNAIEQLSLSQQKMCSKALNTNTCLLTLSEKTKLGQFYCIIKRTHYLREYCAKTSPSLKNPGCALTIRVLTRK